MTNRPGFGLGVDIEPVLHLDDKLRSFLGQRGRRHTRLAVEFAAAYGGYTKEVPGEPGLIARIDGNLRSGPSSL